MRPGHDDERKRDRRAAILLVSAMALSGCSSASSVGSSDSWFGGRVSSLFSSAKPGVTQPASPTPSAPDVECPGVDIRPGASTLNITAKPGQATAGDLRYQLSFGQTARECSLQGGAMSIKVGVQGRVILGPMGGPGIVDVPLRYAVVREGTAPKTIVTKFKRIPVTVAAGSVPYPIRRCRGGTDLPHAIGRGARCIRDLCRVRRDRRQGREEAAEDREKVDAASAVVVATTRATRPRCSSNAGGRPRSSVRPPPSAARREGRRHGCHRRSRSQSCPPQWRQ